MKLFKCLSLMVLAAGLFASCSEIEDPDLFKGSIAGLTVSPAAQKIATDGTAAFTFSFSFKDASGNAMNVGNYAATVNFEATGGSVSPASATTDASGNITVTFTTPDPAGFKGGTVKGTVIKVKENKENGVFQQGTLASATAEVLPLDAEEPVTGEPIEKAKKLKDNTYSVQKKGGEVQVFQLPQEYSSWYIGTSWMDRTKQCIHVECMDEDQDQMTQGWLNGEIPLDVANKLTTINQEFCQKYPWASAKMGTMRLGQDNMIDAHMGQGGNVKLDGSCQFYLKEKSTTKAYSGQYQLLLVMEFENQLWDQEAETYLPGDEYTLCINATLDELIAELSSFRLDYESSWVAPGKSITLTADWTPGAKFDWSKVTLNSQTRNYSSGEWFSWDASTQKLTAVKSADNEEVELTFGYKGTDMTSRISLYNGPGFTSFSVTPRDGSSSYIIAENEPQGWSSNDYVYISVNSFKPEDYYSFNYHSIEIDPASDYYDKLYYNDYGPYVQFNHSIPVGEFNMILRSKADHNVKCTVPIKMVKHKVTKFAIVPHEFYLGYGAAGKVLDVEVTPADATWDWADLEMASNSHIFTYYPGTHTITTTSDAHVLGIQVKFQLKSNNKVCDYVYVDINQQSH